MKSRQDVDSKYKDGPIRRGETFEPCLREAKKILDDPEKKWCIEFILECVKKTD